MYKSFVSGRYSRRITFS